MDVIAMNVQLSVLEQCGAIESEFVGGCGRGECMAVSPQVV